MNTNQIKSFAQKARIILLTGVESRLRYWGFKTSGGHSQAPEAVTGGYTYVGQVYDDPTVPSKWRQIADRCTSAQSYADIKEDAAYTWFNRLMVLRILEANGYIPPTLAFVPGTQTPYILQQAKLGQHDLTSTALKTKLTTFLTEHQDEQALSLLLMHTFNTMPVLRAIFGDVSAYMDLLLPVNILAADGLLAMINDPNAIDPSAYHEVELIGWLYQFYISDKKDEVFAGFKANKKARAEDIPAATQIFTPKWIVRYMVENTLGKLYLDMEPTSRLAQGMKYLVKEIESNKDLVTSDERIDLIPNPYPLIPNPQHLTLIDPASGSGHILVVGFELLMEMYLEQGYTRKAAVISILQHNLYGLDIDDRAAQLARLAVLLKAAQYYPDILTETDYTTVHIHAFPSPQHFTGDEIKGFVGVDRIHVSDALQKALDLMYHGKNIGSALQLTLTPQQRTIIMEQYTRWSEDAASGKLDAFDGLFWQRLRPYLDVLMILTRQYAAVVANPPYMGDKGMNDDLKLYLVKNYQSTYYDLATVFMDVCLALLKPKARYSMINQTSWMLKPSFKTFRENLIINSLNSSNFDSLIYLGPGVFDELKGEVVQSVCFTVVNANLKLSSLYKANEIKGSKKKEEAFITKKIKPFRKSLTDFEEFEGKQFGFWLNDTLLKSFSESPIKYYGDAKQGIKTGDNPRFIKFWHELSFKKMNKKWFPVEKGGEFKKWYGNNNYVLNWENDGYEIRNFENEKGKLRSRPQNLGFFFTEGITWSTSAGNKPSFRFSLECFTFESSGSKFFVTNKKSPYNLKHFIGFFNSEVTKYIVEVFAPGIGFSEGSIKALPFLEIPNENSNSTESLSDRNIFISRNDWDSRETSWDFNQSPLINNSSNLASAYHKWQAQVTDDFFQLHANEEELNRIFIDIYGLQDELTPEVALRDITILQDELDSKDLDAIEPVFRTQGKDAITLPIKREVVMSQFISYCIGTMMGRYRLDKPGLHIAHPDPVAEELEEYQVISNKGWGPDVQQKVINYLCDEYKEFSGSVGLAKIHGSGHRNISGDDTISEGRTVRTEQSTETGSSIHSEQHSRGTSAGHEGISTFPEDSKRIAGRSGDPIGDSAQIGLYGDGKIDSNIESGTGNIQNDQWIKQQAESLIPNPYPLIPNPYPLTPIKIDEDAIIPLMGDDGAFTDDALVRLRHLLTAIWGENTLTENINFLQDGLNTSLSRWLTEQFWPYHCSMYKKKPIYWLFCSDPKKPAKSAFRVLVYMHRMDRFTIQTIRNKYLHPHQEYLQHQHDTLQRNESSLTTHEIKKMETLSRQIIECRQYDDTLKHLANQQITFDLDDGVDRNIALFDGIIATIK